LKIKLAALALIAASIAAGSLYATPTPQGSSPETVRVGGDIKPPMKIKGEPPVYPAFAKQVHSEGVVILEATIGTNGKVKDVKVLRSVKLLENAAVNAVRSWEFKPTVVNGQAVQVIMTIPVNFILE
jgi:periplasmic protein TonB